MRDRVWRLSAIKGGVIAATALLAWGTAMAQQSESSLPYEIVPVAERLDHPGA